MKKNLKYVLIFITSIVIISCEKEKDEVSYIADAIFPIVFLKGEAIIGLPISNTPYVDEGAISIDTTNGAANADTTELTPAINNVDPSKPGFYSVKYTGRTINGFLTSVTRLVLVSGVDANIDYSGVYARVSNGQTLNITKKGPGLYTTDNVGGVADSPEYIFEVYFGQINDTTLQVPIQPNPLGGDVTCIFINLIVSNIDTSFTWVVDGTGFGPAERTFSHQ